MLKKLVKYEWKSTWKMGVIILLAIAGMTLIGTLGVVLPINYLQNNDLHSDETAVAGAFLAMALITSVMLYIVTFVGVTYGMLIYHGVRFYKTMYSDEGYLTHTLPVTSKQLLISKTLVAGIWYLLVGLGIILSIGILVGALFGSLIDDSMMRELAQMHREMELMMEVDSSYIFSIIHGIVYMIAAIIITPFSTMMILFGCLTVGQLSKKYKAFMGILVYIGVTFATSIVGNIVRFVFTIWSDIVRAAGNQTMSSFLLTFGSYDMAILLSLGMAVGFYFGSRHILNKKLNLE